MAFMIKKKQPQPVQLVATPLGFGVSSCEAFHTSIVISGVEYAFSDVGVQRSPCSYRSHQHLPKHPALTKVMLMWVARSEADVMKALGKFFQPGTYDLLRKNCNSWSDCALYYLLGQRLDVHFRKIEGYAHKVDKHVGIVQFFAGYEPNPNADVFVKDDILEHAQDLTKREIFAARSKRRKS